MTLSPVYACCKHCDHLDPLTHVLPCEEDAPCPEGTAIVGSTEVCLCGEVHS